MAMNLNFDMGNRFARPSGGNLAWEAQDAAGEGMAEDVFSHGASAFSGSGGFDVSSLATRSLAGPGSILAGPEQAETGEREAPSSTLREMGLQAASWSAAEPEAIAEVNGRGDALGCVFPQAGRGLGNALGQSLANEVSLQARVPAKGTAEEKAAIQKLFEGGPGEPASSALNDDPRALELFLEQLRNAEGQRAELLQVGLGTIDALGSKVSAIGHDLDRARRGMSGKNQEADFKTFGANLDRDVSEVMGLARDAGLSDAQSALLVNRFVLSRYDALNQSNPGFLWTKLGIYAANTVRIGLVDSFIAAESFERAAATANAVGIDGKLGGKGLAEIAVSLRGMAGDTLQGQIGVLRDVGSMALMHQTYGADAMSVAQFDGMTNPARTSFGLQVQAERALKAGDTSTFYRLQTDAAIEMGRHEQGNLQAMWDKPLMRDFAKFNANIMRWSEGRLAVVRPDIYVGTHPGKDRVAVTIPAPPGSEDLTVLDNRVNIARHGFQVIDAMRRNPADSQLLNFHQDRLGNGKGLVDLPWLYRLSWVRRA